MTKFYILSFTDIFTDIVDPNEMYIKCMGSMVFYDVNQGKAFEEKMVGGSLGFEVEYKDGVFTPDRTWIDDDFTTWEKENWNKVVTELTEHHMEQLRSYTRWQ